MHRRIMIVEGVLAFAGGVHQDVWTDEDGRGKDRSGRSRNRRPLRPDGIGSQVMFGTGRIMRWTGNGARSLSPQSTGDLTA